MKFEILGKLLLMRHLGLDIYSKLDYFIKKWAPNL